MYDSERAFPRKVYSLIRRYRSISTRLAYPSSFVSLSSDNLAWLAVDYCPIALFYQLYPAFTSKKGTISSQ